MAAFMLPLFHQTIFKGINMLNVVLQKPKMLTVLVIMVLCCWAIPIRHAVSAQTPYPGPTDPQQLEAFMDGVMSASLSSNHVPGAVVVVVKDGTVFLAKGYGVMDVATQRPVDAATTLFRPGSVSKLFTWTAVMQLVEAGQLDLDADINTYLDFPIPETFAQPITMRHLMSHTAGFEDVGAGLFKLDAEEIISLEAYLKTRLPTRVFRPGTIGAYSNYGTALAGYIVQRISGLPFEEYVQRNLLTPLSMRHATFQQPLPQDLVADMSGGYGYQAGKYVPGEFEFVLGTPAGALSASGLDMANFMIAHLQNGRYADQRILEESTARQMHSLLYTADERVDGMAYGFFRQTQGGVEVLSHGGDTFLFHSQLSLFPQQNLGMFISTNGASGGLVTQTVYEAFLDYYFPQESKTLTPTSDFGERAEKYTGQYGMSRSNFTSFEKIVSALMGGITITVDQDDSVLVHFGGRTRRYVEVEPGLLINLEDQADRLVLKEVDGHITIHTNAPFVFLKSRWYEHLAVFGFIFLGGLLLFLIMAVRWLGLFFRQRNDGQPSPLSLRLFRVFASLFGIGLLIFLSGLVLTLSDINPAYHVPNIYFGSPSGFEALMVLPAVLMVVAGLLLFLVIAVWLKKEGSVSVRVGYSLMTLMSLVIIWALGFWNFL